MRVLFFNLCVVLMAMASSSFWAQAEGDDTNEIDGPEPTDAESSTLSTDIGDKFLVLMNKHFIDSLNYLYTSKQYDSQYLERPGMAKYLKDASDYEWEQGLDALRKYMQRGGTVDGFRNKLEVTGQGEASFEGSEQRKCNKYVRTFRNVRTDSYEKFEQMNRIVSLVPHDPEITHFLDAKLSKEAERMYDSRIYETVTKSMKTLGLGLKLFDDSL